MNHSCQACQTPHERKAKFCQQCGAKLASAPASSEPESVAERRQITVMFADVVGSTEIAESLDPEDVREVIRSYQSRCREVIEELGGHVAQYLGDGILAYFGYPQAREDAPRNAVRAGLGIISSVRTLPIEASGLQEPLQVRIGIHTGIVVVGGPRGTGPAGEPLAFGGTPNLAARVESSASAGTVVLSAATHKLVSEYFTFRDLGPHVMKGISDPVQLYQVLEETDAKTRFDGALRAGLVPLVGRLTHLDALEAGWRKAKKREGQVVLISGGAGIGKTRLLRALRERIAGDEHVTVDCRCSPNHQNSALYPLLQYVQGLLGFEAGDSAETRLSKLEEGLAPFTKQTTETASLFAAMLSLPPPGGAPPLALTPQSQKQHTMEALVLWLRDTAERQPVHLELEDLHWADPSTLELVDLLVGRSADAPIYLMMTSRETSLLARWESLSHVSHIEIDRLSQPEIEALVHEVAAGRPLQNELVQQIVAKTDGVPLFIEELTKMVVESGGAGDADLTQLSIPATLQDSLMARLDQLPSALGVAQLGATLGREFSHALVRAVSPMDEMTLQGGLDSLVDAGLLVREKLGTESHYTFKHALIQDTAYGSLVRSRRQQFHRAASEVLEQGFAGIVETQPEIVAHHFEAAGLEQRAVSHWQRAAARALGRSAHLEAAHHFSRALGVIEKLAASRKRHAHELSVRMPFGLALIATQGYGSEAVQRNYIRAETLCGMLGDTPERFPTLYGLWVYHLLRGHAESTSELADRLDQIAVRPEHAYIAMSTRGINCYWSGAFAEGEAILAEAEERYDPRFHALLDPSLGEDAALLAHLYRVWCLVELGRFDEVRSSIAGLPIRESPAPSPYVQATARAFEMAALLNAADNEGALAVSAQLIELSTDQNFPFFLAAGIRGHGAALIRLGSVEQGIDEIQQGITTLELIGDVVSRSFWLARVAEGFLAAGNAAEGLAVVEEAFESSEPNLGRYNVIELHRLKGELLLLTPENTAQAEACFRSALEVAARQDAPRLALEASASFARMLAGQGRKDEARELLRNASERMPTQQDSRLAAGAAELLLELS